MTYKSLPLTKERKKIVHLVLHGIAVILGIIGIFMAFKNHNETNTPNLFSLHAWFGIAIISLYALQWVYGFLVFFFPGATPTIRRESLPWHLLLGLFVYILIVGNIALGFLEELTFLETDGISLYGAEALLVNFTAIISVLYGTFVVFTVLSKTNPPEPEFDYAPI